MPIGWTVHVAAEPTARVQRCARCGVRLRDNRLTGSDRPGDFFQAGASIEVAEGNPRYLSVTTNLPNCERYKP